MLIKAIKIQSKMKIFKQRIQQLLDTQVPLKII